MTRDLIGPPSQESGSGVALFLSPHLDDAAFSCGGTVALMVQLGWRVVIATAFTKSVSAPSGFALACQLDKGLSADVDYMALRRDEDEAFARVVGANEVLWLDHPEAPHRGYSSAPELFRGMGPNDNVWHDLVGDLAALRDRLRPDIAFIPTGIGEHVDHLQVIRAVETVPDLGSLILQYRDMPYAIRTPASDADGDPLDSLLHAVDVSSTLSTKLRGAACYTSQIAFQFGGLEQMERSLEHHAHKEAQNDTSSHKYIEQFSIFQGCPTA